MNVQGYTNKQIGIGTFQGWVEEEIRQQSEPTHFWLGTIRNQNWRKWRSCSHFQKDEVFQRQKTKGSSRNVNQNWMSSHYVIQKQNRK